MEILIFITSLWMQRLQQKEINKNFQNGFDLSSNHNHIWLLKAESDKVLAGA